MDISSTIISYTMGLIIIIITLSTFYFPIRIYMALLRYKEAALGLIFTKINMSIQAFKIFAVAVLIFAIGRLFDLYNILSFSTAVDDLTTLMYLITDILLIVSFYKILSIVKIKEA